MGINPKPNPRSSEEVEPVITIQAERVTLLEEGFVCLHLSADLNNLIKRKKNRMFLIVENHQENGFEKLLVHDRNIPWLCKENGGISKKV